MLEKTCRSGCKGAAVFSIEIDEKMLNSEIDRIIVENKEDISKLISEVDIRYIIYFIQYFIFFIFFVIFLFFSITLFYYHLIFIIISIRRRSKKNYYPRLLFVTTICNYIFFF